MTTCLCQLHLLLNDDDIPRLPYASSMYLFGSSFCFSFGTTSRPSLREKKENDRLHEEQWKIRKKTKPFPDHQQHRRVKLGKTRQTSFNWRARLTSDSDRFLVPYARQLLMAWSGQKKMRWECGIGKWAQVGWRCEMREMIKTPYFRENTRYMHTRQDFKQVSVSYTGFGGNL